ncbi:uncharacterized protein LOC142356265 [Convolutriloba macropyga]|uniref:uncharacterized protein LOC142356265 n=1 Tax=Convolutriloba macropyga TaxID=536237 RepID=UPI003F521D03
MLSWVHGCPSRIKAWKDPGEPVVYMRGSAFKSAKELARRLTNRIRRGDLEPSSIFVLAQSVRPGPGETPPPIIILENKLVEAGIPCFSPDSDEESLDDTTIEGKVVFSSIHQSKGLERPVVVCFGFDLGWYEFYGKESDTTTCPNVWYVALTRATKQLMLVAEHSPGQHIPFLRVERLRELAKGSGAHRPPVVEIVESERFAADTSTAAETMKLDRKFSRATVTELTRYMSDGQIEKAFTCLNPKRLAEASMSIKVPDTVPGVGDLVEYVADINGVALIAMYEQMSDSSGDASIIDTLRQTDWASTAAAKDLYEQAQKLIKRALKPPCDPATFLQLASIYQSLGSGFVARPFQILSAILSPHAPFTSRHSSSALAMHRSRALHAAVRLPAQVKSWDYLPKGSVKACMKLLDHHLRGKNVKYEEDLLHTYNDKKFQVEIRGRADALTDDHLWEFKCVGSLRKVHLLQTALYGWLWSWCEEGKKARRRPSFRLLNILTGELWAIDEEFGVDTAVAEIIWAKYSPKPSISDEAFLDRCRSCHQRSSDRSPQREAASPASATKLASSAGRPRPFKCTTCKPTRSFATQQALARHRQKFHKR